MASTGRPLSPHLGIYRWQAQMVSSILHRATGLALAAGSLLVVAGLLTLAAGRAPFAAFDAFCASPAGRLLLLGWTWALAYHLLNGVRHLLQDVGLGHAVAAFVRNSWLAVIGSLLLTVLVWAWVISGGGA